VPSEIPRDSLEFFRLEFTIPEFIAEILNERTRRNQDRDARWRQVADIKQRYLRFVDVTTIREGRLPAFRLELDINWLNRYVETLRPR
jgi:hypothetical protein